jgi:Holliday junction resolvasome RuvABC endonuclease subunit
MTTTSRACEAFWLRNLLKKLDHPQLELTIIYVDNKSAIQLAKNRVMHGKNKHIEIRFHFLRDQVKQKIVTLGSTKEQVANIFTKTLSINAFKKFRSVLGMRQL